MLTTSIHDPALDPSTTCDGCGRPHLLPGGGVYLVPVDLKPGVSRLLVISQGCVVEHSMRLTRVLCNALSPDQFNALLTAMSDPAECVLASDELLTTTATMCGLCDDKLLTTATAMCGLCGNVLDCEGRDDLCWSCYSSMRGW